jgi:hypothetical protein
MTPYELDCLINGAKVFIYRRPDGSAYASLHDFSRFGVEELQIVRVKLDGNSTTESVLADESVKKALSLASNN